MAIEFYRERDRPYGCFSNFSAHGFEADGVWWATAEHYFQAQKFVGTDHADAVREAPDPKTAKQIGGDRSRPLREDWDRVKDNVMRKAVLRKFETHAEIREILLSTGSEELIEKAPFDYYWGCGIKGTGKNMLGKILMEVREALRREPEGTPV